MSSDSVSDGNVKNVVDIDDDLRLVGTAHISSTSVALVRQQIEDWGPDLVAVELCESRKSSLLEPEALENEDLLKILNDCKSHMILLQSALRLGRSQLIDLRIHTRPRDHRAQAGVGREAKRVLHRDQ